MTAILNESWLYIGAYASIIELIMWIGVGVYLYRLNMTREDE